MSLAAKQQDTCDGFTLLAQDSSMAAPVLVSKDRCDMRAQIAHWDSDPWFVSIKSKRIIIVVSCAFFDHHHHHSYTDDEYSAQDTLSRPKPGYHVRAR